jgi:hypothetical protein
LNDKYWVPTRGDIEWTKNLLKSMKQGGVWATTNSANLFKIDHENKEVTAMMCTDAQLHGRLKTILDGLGWSLLGDPTAPERS